jgi:hypothetical protein
MMVKKRRVKRERYRKVKKRGQDKKAMELQTERQMVRKKAKRRCRKIVKMHWTT